MEKVVVRKLRKFRSQAEIKKLLDEYYRSETSMVDFCFRHNISKGTLHNWRHKYGTETKSEDIGFTELSIAPSIPSGLFAEVGSIRIFQPVTAAYLKELSL